MKGSPPHFQNASCAQRAFSLVEMLVVIAIVAIVTGAVFSAFRGIGTGAKLTSAGNHISNLALLARQNSLAKNAMTALVMIGSAGTDGDYRTFALYEIRPRTDGAPAGPGDWNPLGTWESMPDGVVADNCTFTSGTVAMTPAFPPFAFHGKPITDFQYVVFLPTGALLRSDPSCVRLVSGVRSAGAASVTYTAAKGTDGKAANYYQVCLLAASGRVKINRP